MNVESGAPPLHIEFDRRDAVLRVHDPRLFRVDQRALCRRLVVSAAGQPGVRRARVDLASACVELEFERGMSDTPFMADAFVNALREATAPWPRGAPREPSRDWLVLNAARLGDGLAVAETFALGKGTEGVATGLKRLLYLALAGGSFALTLVGLVVPGIPTVPFLLTTSYFLARSSPRLDARLRRAAIVGPVLQEWETEGGLSRLSKGKLAGLTLSVVAVTLLLAPLSPVVFLVIVLISCVSLTGILRLPGLPAQGALAQRHDVPGLLALTAP